MHLIEPFYLWRDIYISENDPNALNYRKEYSEFHFTNRVYNYLLHPQWDNFGSETLFYKQLYVNYDEHFCIIEFMGEWNDCINNDVMQLKAELIDDLIDCGISNFILIFDNVLNFHADEDDYYAEWLSEIDGNIFIVNGLPHILDELNNHHLYSVLSYGGRLNDLNWRPLKPDQVLEYVETKFLEENE